jgi:hypothetical protein
MVVVGEAALVIVAAVPLVCDQAPVPVVIVLAAMVAVGVVVHTSMSLPAAAVVGAAFTVKVQFVQPLEVPVPLRGNTFQA